MIDIQVQQDSALGVVFVVCALMAALAIPLAFLNRYVVRPLRELVLDLKHLIEAFPDVRKIVADHLEHDHDNTGNDRRTIERLLAIRSLRGTP